MPALPSSPDSSSDYEVFQFIPKYRTSFFDCPINVINRQSHFQYKKMKFTINGAETIFPIIDIQDGIAHRHSEIEMFAGTVRKLAAKHKLAVPVNDWLYTKITEMEAAW